MQRSIVTQAGLAAIRLALDQVAENLSAHVNQSLSRAHGINLIDSPYEDSVGNQIGAKQLRWSVNGQIFYSPASLTAEAGQALSTGAIDTSGEDAAVGGVDRSAWVTDFASQHVAAAENINTESILPHSRQSAEDVHGDLVAVTPSPSPVDTRGNIIGRSQILIHIGGKQYAIPADTRLGGPPQAPRNASIMPPTIYIEAEDHGSSLDNSEQRGTFTVSVPQGTSPISLVWQAKVPPSSSFVDLTVTTTDFGPTPLARLTVNGNQLFVTGAHSQRTWQLACEVRAKFTNSSGTLYTNVVSFYSMDVNSWFIAQAAKTWQFTVRDWQMFAVLKETIFRNCPRGLTSYAFHGGDLVKRMRAGGVTQAYFEVFAARTLDMCYRGRWEEATLYTIQSVAEATRQYWPDCPHRGMDASLKWLHQVTCTPCTVTATRCG